VESIRDTPGLYSSLQKGLQMGLETAGEGGGERELRFLFFDIDP
jgi:hypothetical protein